LPLNDPRGPGGTACLGIVSLCEIQEAFPGEWIGQFGQTPDVLRPLLVELIVHVSPPHANYDGEYNNKDAVHTLFSEPLECDTAPELCSAQQGTPMAAIFPIRKSCPGCGKPMKLVASETEAGREEYRCTDCDGIDPLQSSIVRGWIESPLKPPK
jgi:hypothetical protein